MATVARWCFRHRRVVLLGWLAALIVTGGIARSVGNTYSTNFSFPSTDSTRASNVLKANFPAQAGDIDQIVVHARTGTLDDRSTRQAVTAMLDQVADLPHVRAVTSPYESGLIGAGRTIGLATVNFDKLANSVPDTAVRRVIETAKAIDRSSIDV